MRPNDVEDICRPLLEDDDDWQDDGHKDSDIQLHTIRHGHEPQLHESENLSNDAAQQLIDGVDKVRLLQVKFELQTNSFLQSLSESNPPSSRSEYGLKLRHLSKICEKYRLLPSSCILHHDEGSPRLVVQPQAFAQGGFADVYRGSLDGFGEVVVKRLRADVVQQVQPQVCAQC